MHFIASDLSSENDFVNELRIQHNTHVATAAALLSMESRNKELLRILRRKGRRCPKFSYTELLSSDVLYLQINDLLPWYTRKGERESELLD